MAQKNYQLLGDQAWKKMEKAVRHSSQCQFRPMGFRSRELPGDSPWWRWDVMDTPVSVCAIERRAVRPDLRRPGHANDQGLRKHGRGEQAAGEDVRPLHQISRPIERQALRQLCGVVRGNNIGMRVIDEYFAKSGVGRCTDFKDAAESLTRVPCGVCSCSGCGRETGRHE